MFFFCVFFPLLVWLFVEQNHDKKKLVNSAVYRVPLLICVSNNRVKMLSELYGLGFLCGFHIAERKPSMVCFFLSFFLLLVCKKKNNTKNNVCFSPQNYFFFCFVDCFTGSTMGAAAAAASFLTPSHNDVKVLRGDCVVAPYFE